MSGGENSHAKKQERSPLAAVGIASKRPHLGCPILPAERRAPHKYFLQRMRDSDIDMSTPTVEPTQVSTLQSCNEGVGKKSASIRAPIGLLHLGRRSLRHYDRGTCQTPAVQT
jgi:hypothetical protein